VAAIVLKKAGWLAARCVWLLAEAGAKKLQKGSALTDRGASCCCHTRAQAQQCARILWTRSAAADQGAREKGKRQGQHGLFFLKNAQPFHEFCSL
jgi:hypothetical protein